MAKDDKKPVLDDERTPVESADKDVTSDSEKERKVAPQNRGELKDTDHVQFHLDKDPNDPRGHETPKLPSLNDEGQS